MKLGKFLSMGVLSVLALGACTPNADDNSEWNDGSQPVSFISQIQGVKTRASNNAWDQSGNDQVGVFVKQNGAFGNDVNKHYYVSAAGNLTTASEADAIYYPETGSVDFVAYYPYATTLTNNAFAVDVTDQSSQPAIDLLYSINATNKDKSNVAPVQLSFKHQLVKIVLNISKDATIASLDGLQVNIAGTKTKGSFALLNGVLTPDEASIGNIAAKVSNAGALAEAIILPVNGLSGGEITFTIGGKTKTWNIPSGQNYAAGSQYTYPVILKETGGQISVSFGDAAIDDWTPVVGGDINIDFGEGGGQVDPPTPGGEEVTIFTETFGDEVVAKGSGWPYVSKFTNWSNPWTFTDKTSTMSIRAIEHKTEANPTEKTKINNLWVPATKNSTLEITGINTEGYTKMKFGFEIAADSYNFSGGTKITEQELNVLKITWNGQAINIPSKVVTSATANMFFTFEIATDLVGAANSTMEISAAGDANAAGLRVANIKILGTK